MTQAFASPFPLLLPNPSDLIRSHLSCGHANLPPIRYPWYPWYPWYLRLTGGRLSYQCSPSLCSPASRGRGKPSSHRHASYLEKILRVSITWVRVDALGVSVLIPPLAWPGTSGWGHRARGQNHLPCSFFFYTFREESIPTTTTTSAQPPMYHLPAGTRVGDGDTQAEVIKKRKRECSVQSPPTNGKKRKNEKRKDRQQMTVHRQRPFSVHWPGRTGWGKKEENDKERKRRQMDYRLVYVGH